MKPSTHRTLLGSIRKWELIVEGKKRDGGVSDCPLCVRFYDNIPQCEDCPVKKKVGYPGCRRTPWAVWHGYMGYRLSDYASTPKAKELAQAEVDFLKSLLPKRKLSMKRRR